MKSTYYPSHGQNRMKHEGDVVAAREYFMTGKNRVLYNLIRQRFIKNDKLVLTDITEHEWVDKRVDAMNIDYPDESIDVIICSNMIHHISNPSSFLDNV